jgi:hypothetical protein
MNRECAATITSTGNNTAVPSSSVIRLGGNHRSHWAASPPAYTSRSAGSTKRCSGRSRLTLSRNHVIDPCRSTRSASTVAGISASNARTLASNSENDVCCGARSYLAHAATPTHDRPLTGRSPNPKRPDDAEHHPRPAARPTPNPPPRSPTQSVWVASFSPAGMASSSSVVDSDRFTHYDRGLDLARTAMQCPVLRSRREGSRHRYVADRCSDIRWSAVGRVNPSRG